MVRILVQTWMNDADKMRRILVSIATITKK